MNKNDINISNDEFPIKGGNLEKIKDFLFFYKHSGLFLIFPTLIITCIIGISANSIGMLMKFHKKAVAGIIETIKKDDLIIEKSYKCGDGFLDCMEIIKEIPKPQIISDLLIDDSNANFGHAKHYELIPGVNVPTDEEIKFIVENLKLIYDKDISKTQISIKGVSSPEGSSPESLIGKDKESFNKNNELARKRAEYVANMLSSLNPEIKKDMISIISEVKTLSQEEINELFKIASRLNIFKDNNLSSVNELIKQINNGTINFELTEEEEKIINDMLSRNVVINSSLITENKMGYESMFGIGINKGPLLFILFIGLVGFSMYSFMTYFIGYQKINDNYKDLLDIKDKLDLTKKEEKKLELYGSKLKWSISINNIIFDYDYFKIAGRKFIKNEDNLWILEGTKDKFSRKELLKIISNIPVKYNIELGYKSGDINSYNYSQICTMNMEKIKESFDLEHEIIRGKYKGLIQKNII